MTRTLKKIRRIPNLYEEAVDRIKEAIFAGEYRSGEALPSEVEMALQLGVSRPVVREAYKSLQSLGFLEIRRGTKGGAFVSDLDNLSFAENLSDLIRLRKISVDSLVDTRLLLEPEIAFMAAKSATPEQLAEMEELLNSYDNSKDTEERVIINSTFHRLIGRACGNPLYAVLLESIMDFTETFIKTIKPVSRVLHEAHEHRSILESLKEGNGEKTAELVRRHIQHISDEMRALEETYLKLAAKRTS